MARSPSPLLRSPDEFHNRAAATLPLCQFPRHHMEDWSLFD